MRCTGGRGRGSDAPDQQANQRMSADRRRLTFALLFSLLIHALLLSLTFGGQGLGLPGFGFPWEERRVEVPDLRIVILPTPVTAAEPAVSSVDESRLQASIEQVVAGEPTQTASPPPAPAPEKTADAVKPRRGAQQQPSRRQRPVRNQIRRPERLPMKPLCPPRNPGKAHRPRSPMRR
jgi:hypothetical protein